jgi:hypothetical protein
MDFPKFRKSELEQYKAIWLTKEVYAILRSQKRKQKISMAKIVCNLIIEKYGNIN